jgi:hypothetical protein
MTVKKEDYSVKNVKTFQGMEGEGFNASLYRKNKKVAFVIDEGSGGDFLYEWNDRNKEEVDIHVITRQGEKHTFKGTPEEKKFYELVETFPSETIDLGGKDHEMKVSVDMFVGELIDKYEFQKLTKKNYLFQIGDDIGTDNYQVIKKKPGITKERVEQYIKQKYPKKKYKLLG